jgi:hypothetical protein
MEPPLDVFAIDRKSVPHWLGPANDLKEAQQMILRHNGGAEYEYLVHSQVTGSQTHFAVRDGQVVRTH